MAVVHAVGSFSIAAGSTSAVPVDLSALWSDAGSHTPQAVLFFYHSGSVGTSTGNSFYGSGMTDGTNHYGHAVHIVDNVTTGNSNSYHTANAPIIECDGSSALTGQADFTSFASNTFTVTPSDAFVNAHTVFFIAFAGYTNVKVNVRASPNATGNFSTTGIGFLPTSAFCMQGLGSLDTSGNTIATPTFGFAANATDQYVLGCRLTSGTTNYSWGHLMSGRVTVRCGAGDVQDEVALVSFDADGATFNKVVNFAAHTFATLFLQGGAVKAQTTTHRTSTGTFTVACAGINPSLILGIAHNPNTALMTTTPTESANVSIGAATSVSQWALNFHTHNRETLGTNATEEYIRSATDKFMVHFDRASADSFTATGEIVESAWAAGQVTLDQTDANTALVIVPTIILGEAVSHGGAVHHLKLLGAQ